MQVHLRSRSRLLVISVACALLSFIGVAQLSPHSARADVNEIAVGAPTAASFASLTGGQQHTCAVLAAGTVKCWGLNSSGQIGIGNTTSPQKLPVDVLTAPSTPLTDVVAVSAFGNFACALKSGRTVMCWGNNTYGQVGNGTITTPQSFPVEVVGLAGVSAITTGEYHACALLSTGTIKCWGYNHKGQLGNGSLITSSSPVDVVGLTGAVAVSAGGSHTCALLAAGTVKCWGFNSTGQLGRGGFVDSSSPVDVLASSSGASPLSGVTVISGGAAHTCALVSGGVKCWGDNTQGQLGNGSSGTGVKSETPVDVRTSSSDANPLSGVTALSTKAHSCALLSGGMKCWGSNNRGQLGNGLSGTGVVSSTPVDVSVLPTSATAMTTGNGHTCALLSTGKLTCWGWNASGQLGDNTTTSSSSAVDVSGLSSGITTTVTLAPTTVPAPSTTALSASAPPAPPETVPATTVVDTVPPATTLPPVVQVESLPNTGSSSGAWPTVAIGVLLLGSVTLAARRRLTEVGD